MIILGLDCDAPLDPKLIPIQYRYVMRYLAPHDNPLTRAEVAAYTARGLGVVALCEHSITDVAGGANAGAINAKQWIAEARSLGMPPGSVLIAACDEDPTSAVVTEAIAYYRTIASACRADRYLGGAYGGHDLVVTLANVVDVLMQSGAWSGGVVAPGIDLFQEIATVTIGGVECDVDQAFTTHFGAFNAAGLWPPAPVPPIPKPTPPPEDEVTLHTVTVTIGANGQGQTATTVPYANAFGPTILAGEGPVTIAEVSIADANGDAVIVLKGGPAGSKVSVRFAEAP